jgi:hypothetical protein
MVIFYCQLRVFRTSDETFKKTMIAANRAWVVPHLLKIMAPLEDGKNATLMFTYGNSGHEPAIRVGHKSDSKGIPIDAVANATPATAVKSLNPAIESTNFADTCADAENDRTLGVIYPAQSPDSAYTTIIVDRQWIKQPLIDGLGFLVVKGCFSYETMTEPHQSKYCFFYNKVIDGIKPQEFRGLLSSCPSGNEAN